MLGLVGCPGSGVGCRRIFREGVGTIGVGEGGVSMSYSRDSVDPSVDFGLLRGGDFAVIDLGVVSQLRSITTVHMPHDFCHG